MKKEKRKPRKELSIGVKLILILMFSVVFVAFGICFGFLINSFLNPSTNNIIINAVFTLVVGIVYMTLLLILIRDKDKEKVQSIKWYFNGILISLMFNLIITALTLFALGVDENNFINYVLGFGIFPLIGIITTPNIVKYVKKDTTKWKHIFYNNGNLHLIRGSKDFYRVLTPVSFEKKILSEVYKEQLKNLLVVIGFMIIVIASFLVYIINDHSYSDNVISALIELKIKRAAGFMFFLTIIFVTFGIPIISFYIANALKKVRVVKNHEYLAYHAIVSGVRSGKVIVSDNNNHYKYNYCTCVGIKEKEVHQTPATLIFVPDDVLLFPDCEDYKVEKYDKKKV